jgi:hypothetical protein
MTAATPLAYTHSAIGDFTIRDVIEGQTAGQLIVAADDWGWWTTLLGGDTIAPTTGIPQAVAVGLVRAGFLTRVDGAATGLSVVTQAAASEPDPGRPGGPSLPPHPHRARRR